MTKNLCATLTGPPKLLYFTQNKQRKIQLKPDSIMIVLARDLAGTLLNTAKKDFWELRYVEKN